MTFKLSISSEDDVDGDEASKQRKRKSKSVTEILNEDSLVEGDNSFGLSSRSISKRCQSFKKPNTSSGKVVIDVGETSSPRSKRSQAYGKANFNISDQCKGVASTSHGRYRLGDEDVEALTDLMGDERTAKRPKHVSSRRSAYSKVRMSQKGTGNSSTIHKEAGKLLRDVTELFERCDGLANIAKKIEDQDFEEETLQSQQRRRVVSQKDLEIELESTILEERYMTEKDYQIFQEDVPERLQYWIQKVGEVSQSSKAGESEWIYERLFGILAISMPTEFGEITNLDRSQIVEQITNILQLLHDQKVEIPFIAMYRKELCLNLLVDTEDLEQSPILKRYKALWAVWYLDRKWQLLQHRRAGLKAAFASHTFKLKDRSADQQELLKQVIEALEAAQSEEEVDDIERKFSLYFSNNDVETGGQYKRPKWRSEYSIYCMDGYRQISKHFGLSPKHLGENLQAKSKVNVATDSTLTPEEAAADFCSTKHALQCARNMVALEISVEPSVCDYFRKFFSESCAVTTRPTSEGLRIIDSFHPYARVKFLENQPLDKFVDDSWLLIQNAEEEKLLEVRLGFEEQFLENHLLQEVIPLYLSDDAGPNVELWNEQRRQALQHSVSYLIVPNLEKEIRLKLSGRAKQWVATHCGDRLWKLASMPPYSSPAENSEAESFKGDGKRVMACCWGPGNPATTFVILDSWGNLSAILYTGYLGSHAYSLEQQQRKQKDQQQLLQFFINNRPDVLVLGANNVTCRYLKADIDEVVGKLQESNYQSVDTYTFQVIYGDEAIPRLYDQSNAAEEQLKQQPGIVRRAVGLGRYLQNPLALVSSLFGRSKDILSLKLHRLQGSLDPDELYEVFECVMVTLTNQVGLDLCPALSHEWLLAPLQFISGIGPRKSAFIAQAFRSIKSLNSRQDLLSSLGLMKENIFLNAAGFIRISKNMQTSTVNQGSNDVLDDTRIHPESYELANKMAEDACCQESVDNVVDLEAENVDVPVLYVRKHPHKLQQLVLESYASIVEARGSGKKLETLRDIKIELQHGFQDWRGQYTSPSEDETFWLLTGENEESLAEGKLVKATVRKVQENQVLCVLECGLLGKISTKDHQEGTILECIVKEIDKTSYFVQLAICNEELISDIKRLNAVSEDVSLMPTAQEQLPKMHEDKQINSESEKTKFFKQRLIVHPYFKNCSLVEAKEELSRKDAGSVLFHPSTKGASYLCMTLKLYDEIYMLIDISERQKDIHDLASFLHLGNALLIGDKVFEDLDQVIAQYASPLMSNWREMHQHRKFMLGAKAEVDEQICKEKKESPSRIPYHFALCYEHPGVFILAYARSNPSLKLHHEFVSVVPSGFRFRKTMFEKPDELVDYFQKHFNDSILPLPLISERQIDFGRDTFRGRGRRGRGNTGQRYERNLDSSREGQENSESAQWNEGRNWNGNDESDRGRGRRQNGRGRGSGRRGRWSNQGDYKKEEQSFDVAAHDSTGGWDEPCTDAAELSGRGPSDWNGGWNKNATTENNDGWNKANGGSDAGGWGESRELANNDLLPESAQWNEGRNRNDNDESGRGRGRRQNGRGRGSGRRGRWSNQGDYKKEEQSFDVAAYDSTGGWDGPCTDAAELSGSGPSDWNGGWNKNSTTENNDGWNKANGGSDAGGWGESRELANNDLLSESAQWNEGRNWNGNDESGRGRGRRQNGRGRGRGSGRRGRWSNQGDYKKEEQSFDVATYDSTGGWDGPCTDAAELSGRGPSDWNGGWNKNATTENIDGWNKANGGSDAGGWGESRELANNDLLSDKNGNWNMHNKKDSDGGGWGGSKELVGNDWGQSQDTHDKSLNGKDEGPGSWQLDKMDSRDSKQAVGDDNAWQTGRGRGSERSETWGWNQGGDRLQEDPSEKHVVSQGENQSNDRTITGKDGCDGESGWAEQSCIDLKTENLGKEEPGNTGWGRTVKTNEGWDGCNETASGDRGNLENAEKGWDIPGMTNANDGWERLHKENEALPNEVKEPLNDGGWGWSVPSVDKAFRMSEIDSSRGSEDGSRFSREKVWNRGRGENFSGHGHGRGWTGRGSIGRRGGARGSRQYHASESFASEDKGSKWDRVTTFATAGEPGGGLQSGWSENVGTNTAGKGWETQGLDKVDDGWENFNKEKDALCNEAKKPLSDGCAATEDPRGGFQGSWNKDVSADTAGKGLAARRTDEVDDGWGNFSKAKDASHNEVKEPSNDGGTAAEESRGAFLGAWNKDVSEDTVGKELGVQRMNKVNDGWETVFNKDKEALPHEVKEPSNAGGWGCSFPSKNEVSCVSKNDSDRDSENRSAYLTQKIGDKGRDESISGHGCSWGRIDTEKGAGKIGDCGWGEEGGIHGDQVLESFALKDKGCEWGGDRTVATAQESPGHFQCGWKNDAGARTVEKGWDVQAMEKDDNNWGKLNKNDEAVPTDVKDSLDYGGWGQGFSSFKKDTCMLENDSKSESEGKFGYSREKSWNRGKFESQDSRGRGWQHIERGRGRGGRGGRYWGERRGSVQNQVSEAFPSKDHGRDQHGDAMTATVRDTRGGFQACWTDAVVEKTTDKGWETQGSDKSDGGWEMLSKEKLVPNEVKDPLDDGGWGWSNASKSSGVSEKFSGDRFGHSRSSSRGREQHEGQFGHGRSWGRSGRGRGRERTDGHGWGGGTNDVGMETSGNKWITQGMTNDDKCWSNLHEKKDSSSNEAKDDGGWGWNDPSVIKNTSGAVDRDSEKLPTDTSGDSRVRSWNRGVDNNQTSGDWEQRGTWQGKERTNSCGWGGGSTWKGVYANLNRGEEIGWTNNTGKKTTENGWSTQETVKTTSDDTWGEINQDGQPLSNESKEPQDDGGWGSSIVTNMTSELGKGSCRDLASDSKPWNRGRSENVSHRSGAWGQTGGGRGMGRSRGFKGGWERSSQQNQGSEAFASKDDKPRWSVACSATTVGLSPVGSQLGWSNEAPAETSKNGWCAQEIASSDDGWGKLDEEIKPLDTAVKKHSDDSGWG